MASPAIPKPQGGNIDRSPTVLGVYWTEAVVAIFIVSLRMYSRRLVRSTGWDDWTMVIALASAFQLTLAGLVTKYSLLGGFRHLYYLDPPTIQEVTKWDYILQCFGIIAFTPPKVSVGLLIMRLINPLRDWRFWTIVAVLCLMTLVNVLNAIFTYAQCIPPETLWNHAIQGKCWVPSAQKNFSIFQASLSIFTDVVLALTPITIISKLNMRLPKKIALCMLLGVGLFAAVSGCIKASYLSSLSARSDVTWVMYNLIIWSGSENFVVLFCGCVPPLRSLWVHYQGSSLFTSLRSLFGRSDRSLHKRIIDGEANNSGFAEGQGFHKVKSFAMKDSSSFARSESKGTVSDVDRV